MPLLATPFYSSTTDDHGNPGYAAWGGTSMARHVAGAMGVLMSRYDQMNALQVRDVMFTTANHKNADGTNMEGWTDVDGTVRGDGEVSDRMGWGVPDLDKGMCRSWPVPRHLRIQHGLGRFS
ncbi:MAG: S8 family serine peptidase [Sutterella wadsworthensis]